MVESINPILQIQGNLGSEFGNELDQIFYFKQENLYTCNSDCYYKGNQINCQTQLISNVIPNLDVFISSIDSRFVFLYTNNNFIVVSSTTPLKYSLQTQYDMKIGILF